MPALDVTQRSEEELVETHLFLRSVNDHRVAGQFHNMEETLRHAKPGEHGSLEGVANLHVLQLGIIDKVAEPVQEVDVHQVNAIYQSPVALIELLKVNVENVERLIADMPTNNLAQLGSMAWTHGAADGPFMMRADPAEVLPDLQLVGFRVHYQLNADVLQLVDSASNRN